MIHGAGIRVPITIMSKTVTTSGFLTILSPQINAARERLRAGIADMPDEGKHSIMPEPAALEAMLFAGVRGHLERIVTPTLALELNIARLRGRLHGDTPEERFDYYAKMLARREYVEELATEYPMLFQLAEDRLALWVAVSLELIGRIAADWQDIVETFFRGESPGALESLRFPQRSTKRGGRAVVLLCFSSGARLVYKPRSLAVEARFQELLDWLGDSGFQPGFQRVKLLDRDSHGWMEWIDPEGCASAAEIQRFYRRQGAYLALFYALEATDLHMSNVIAAGEHPALIDLETLFHPRDAVPDWPVLDLLLDDTAYYSVLRSGLLPEPETAEAGEPDRLDLSGLAGAGGQRTPYEVPMWRNRGTDAMRLERERKIIGGGKNRPSLDGKAVDALDFVDALESGFTDTYRLLAERRAELLANNSPLARFAGAEVRVLPRSGRRYGSILENSYHPDLMRDPSARLNYLADRLRQDAAEEIDPVRLISHELDDLAAGDTPFFTTRVGSRGIAGSRGAAVADFFARSGLEMARARIARLDEDDLMRQRWFIRASFATVAITGLPGDRRLVPAAVVPANLSEKALAAARAIGEQLARTAVRAGHEASWIGLEPDEYGLWSIEPLGSDPDHGLPGVIRFLSALAALTGERRWEELACAAGATLQRYLAEEAEEDESTSEEDLPGEFETPYHVPYMPDPLDDSVASDNHSLTGDLGIVERLLVAADAQADDDLRNLAARYAATVIADIEQRGPLTGVPLGVESPGLMTGLAGIGYGLLRVAAPESIPPLAPAGLAEAAR